MKNSLFVLPVAIFAFAWVASSFAVTGMPQGNERQWEATGDTTGSFNLEKPKLFGVAGNIGYFLDRSAFEISLGAGFNSYEDSLSTTATSLFLAAGPILNMSPDDLEDSIYVGMRAGFARNHSGLYDLSFSSFAWQAFLGKRFRIVEHVCWAPEFDYYQRGDTVESDGTQVKGYHRWTVTPLRFSFLF